MCGQDGQGDREGILIPVAYVDLQRRPVSDTPGFCAEADRVVLDMTYTAGYDAEFGAQGTDGVRCTAETQQLGETTIGTRPVINAACGIFSLAS